jgi:hypothetical protein
VAHPEFDDSVFEGVEGDDGDAAVGEEAGWGGGEGALEAAELVVDGDAEGLAGAGQASHGTEAGIVPPE